METCLNYCDRNAVFFSSDERTWILRIRKLKERHPEAITIIKEPEDNDGSIYCKIPINWFKIAPPRKVNMTEERRAELRAQIERVNASK